MLRPLVFLSRREREQKGSFYYASAAKPFGDTVDAYLRARRVLVAARRTGDPDSADDLLASLDWQRSFCRGDLVEVQRASPRGRERYALTEFTRGRTERQGGIRLAQTVLEGMRICTVVMQHHHSTGGAVQHRHRHFVPVLTALLQGPHRCLVRRAERQGTLGHQRW